MKKYPHIKIYVTEPEKQKIKADADMTGHRNLSRYSKAVLLGNKIASVTDLKQVKTLSEAAGTCGKMIGIMKLLASKHGDKIDRKELNKTIAIAKENQEMIKTLALKLNDSF